MNGTVHRNYNQFMMTLKHVDSTDKYLRILKEVDITENLFKAVHQRFLAAIDHLDYYYPYSNESSRKEIHSRRGILS